jgi:polyisoprenyl-teichoic acid--peptidoglycan teichoic acid transferase
MSKPEGDKGGKGDPLASLRSLGSQIEPPAGDTVEADEGPQPASEHTALAGLEALGDDIEHAHKPARGRGRHASGTRRHRWRRWVLAGLAVVLLLVAAGAGYVYYLTHDLQRITVKGLHSAFHSGQEVGTENILMVGSTSRCALSVQNPAYGLCSQGVTGVNSDVMMILHADPSHHRLALLSIPRDLFIPNARSTGPNKIDAGLEQGLSQLVAAIEEDFGIPIQHAVSLNFDQFANIVDALGGINMSFPISVFDWGSTGGGVDGDQPVSSGLNQRAAACVHLDGTQALQVVRARHLRYETPESNPNDPYSWQPEAESDLARIQRDHEFLRVLATAVAEHGIDNPISDLSLINSVKADLLFDQTWPVSDMVNLVLDFHSVNINSVPQLTLPVQIVTDPDGSGGSLQYEGGSYGDVEFPAEAQDLAAIEQLLGIGGTTDSMTGQPLPAPSSVSVSVLNGTGAANQAADTAAGLTALGYHISGVSDTAPVGDVSETYVYYGSRDAQTEAAAESVTRAMSGSVIMAYDPAAVTDGAEVTVVTGSQFSVNPPASPAVASTSVTSQSTTSTTSVPATSVPAASGSAAGAIAAPNTSNIGLAKWDPRACAAGAVPVAPSPNPTG